MKTGPARTKELLREVLVEARAYRQRPEAWASLEFWKRMNTAFVLRWWLKQQREME